MEGTGANLRLPLNPPFFFESAVSYDVTTGAGSGASGFADLVPGTTPTGNVRAYDPNLRPQFTQQWNVFVEHQLTSSHVGAGRLRRPQGGPPGDAGRGQPGAAGRRRPVHLGAEDRAPAALRRAAAHHDHRDDGRARQQPLQLPAGERAAAHAGTASSSWRRTRSGKVRTNNRGFYGVFGGTGLQGVTSATEGAYWQNTYDPEAECGPAFFDVRHNLIVSAHGSCRSARTHLRGGLVPVMDAILGGWRLSGIFQARSGLPVTVTRRREPVAAGRARASGPNCVGDWKPSDQIDHATGWTSTRSRPCPSARSATARWASRAAPGYTNLDAVLSKRFSVGGQRAMPSSASRRSTCSNHPSFGPPARDISVPNTFGTITSTVSSPRVIELGFKFFF